jgi:hypothetical protein
MCGWTWAYVDGEVDAQDGGDDDEDAGAEKDVETEFAAERDIGAGDDLACVSALVKRWWTGLGAYRHGDGHDANISDHVKHDLNDIDGWALVGAHAYSVLEVAFSLCSQCNLPPGLGLICQLPLKGTHPASTIRISAIQVTATTMMAGLIILSVAKP